jgi:hypothetical protein
MLIGSFVAAFMWRRKNGKRNRHARYDTTYHQIPIPEIIPTQKCQWSSSHWLWSYECSHCNFGLYCSFTFSDTFAKQSWKIPVSFIVGLVICLSAWNNSVPTGQFFVKFSGIVKLHTKVIISIVLKLFGIMIQ